MEISRHNQFISLTLHTIQSGIRKSEGIQPCSLWNMNHLVQYIHYWSLLSGQLSWYCGTSVLNNPCFTLQWPQSISTDIKAEITVRAIRVLYGNNAKHMGVGKSQWLYRGYNPEFPASTLGSWNRSLGVRATAVEECSWAPTSNKTLSIKHHKCSSSDAKYETHSSGIFKGAHRDPNLRWSVDYSQQIEEL